MPSHLFLVNVHADAAQAVRQCRILRAHFGEDSGVLVLCDGPHGDETDWELAEIATEVNRIPYQPDKCLGITRALSSLVARAAEMGAEVVSFLHPDMVPTDRQAWQTFLKRFRVSGKALTYAPMRPGQIYPSFCAMHFRLPEALKLFPITTDKSHEWLNEPQTFLSWHRSCPGWHENTYPLALVNWPHSCDATGCHHSKRMHGPGFNFIFHDYVPETSVIHTNDPGFWDNYEKVLRA